ncbi:DUF1579 domain-containing protein [soil metagenome]
MSTDNQEQEMGTKPLPEHAWIQQLVGNWTTETVMTMPDGTTVNSVGSENCIDFGGLWAIADGKNQMPGGGEMAYKVGLGYDVSFNAYRAFMVMSMSSHLWKYDGTLSDDGKTMTLDCEGPDMEVDGKTAHYRDTIEIIDADHRTLTSTAPGEDGNWVTYMVSKYTRA